MITLRPSNAWRLMRAPAREYRQRVAESRSGRWPRALATPALIALILGLVTAVAGTGRATLSLVVSGTICWSFVVLLQLVTAIALIQSARCRRVDLARGVELVFDGHGPWSLWLVGIGVLHSVSASPNIMAASALVPFAWTARILSRFGEEALGLTSGGARVRVLAHQIVTVLLILLYVEVTTRLSLRMLAALQ